MSPPGRPKGEYRCAQHGGFQVHEAFRSLADIEALERTPYQQAIPARTTYGLIARAARLHPERAAFVYMP
ncbi:MAG: acyl-CoA synthetase, partial [Ramlibacter sp.]|nr:acyl-CoA synthetase [Ramlibacter sp.]